MATSAPITTTNGHGSNSSSQNSASTTPKFRKSPEKPRLSISSPLKTTRANLKKQGTIWVSQTSPHFIISGLQPHHFPSDEHPSDLSFQSDAQDVSTDNASSVGNNDDDDYLEYSSSTKRKRQITDSGAPASKRQRKGRRDESLSSLDGSHLNNSSSQTPLRKRLIGRLSTLRRDLSGDSTPPATEGGSPVALSSVASQTNEVDVPQLLLPPSQQQVGTGTPTPALSRQSSPAPSLPDSPARSPGAAGPRIDVIDKEDAPPAKDPNELTEKDLPEPFLPIPIIDDRSAFPDEAGYILAKTYSPIENPHDFIKALNSHDLSLRSTETLLKLAANTQRALKAWQDEYIRLDAKTAAFGNPPKKPATGGRVPQEPQLFERAKEIELWGYVLGIEGTTQAESKKQYLGNGSAKVPEPVVVEGTRTLRRRHADASIIDGVAASEDDGGNNSNDRKRTRRAPKRFDAGSNENKPGSSVPPTQAAAPANPATLAVTGMKRSRNENSEAPVHGKRRRRGRLAEIAQEDDTRTASPTPSETAGSAIREATPLVEPQTIPEQSSMQHTIQVEPPKPPPNQFVHDQHYQHPPPPPPSHDRREPVMYNTAPPPQQWPPAFRGPFDREEPPPTNRSNMSVHELDHRAFRRSPEPSYHHNSHLMPAHMNGPTPAYYMDQPGPPPPQPAMPMQAYYPLPPPPPPPPAHTLPPHLHHSHPPPVRQPQPLQPTPAPQPIQSKPPDAEPSPPKDSPPSSSDPSGSKKTRVKSEKRSESMTAWWAARKKKAAEEKIKELRERGLLDGSAGSNGVMPEKGGMLVVDARGYMNRSRSRGGGSVAGAGGSASNAPSENGTPVTATSTAATPSKKDRSPSSYHPPPPPPHVRGGVVMDRLVGLQPRHQTDANSRAPARNTQRAATATTQSANSPALHQASPPPPRPQHGQNMPIWNFNHPQHSPPPPPARPADRQGEGRGGDAQRPLASWPPPPQQQQQQQFSYGSLPPPPPAAQNPPPPPGQQQQQQQQFHPYYTQGRPEQGSPPQGPPPPPPPQNVHGGGHYGYGHYGFAR